MSEQRRSEVPFSERARTQGTRVQLALVATLQNLPEKLGTPRHILIAAAIIFVVALVAIIALLPVVFGLSQDDLEPLGYPGVFLANFFGTATVFIPVPGLTAAGQALIVVMAERLNPLAVALVASAGMTLAEITAYLTGRIGRTLSEERRIAIKGRVGNLLRGIVYFIDWLMAHYGFLTLLTLSAVPNPFFEFAGITAGAVRMNFARFITAVGIGKTIRALILAYLGDVFIEL
jgi:membrane protein YqaA with SNARE-associated domain